MVKARLDSAEDRELNEDEVPLPCGSGWLIRVPVVILFIVPGMRIRLLFVGVVRTSKKEASSEGLNTDHPRPPAKKKKKEKKNRRKISYITWDLFKLIFKSSELICSSYVALIQKSLVSSWGSWLHMLFFLSLWKSNCSRSCVITWTVLISHNQKHNFFFCWEYTAQNVRGLQRCISALKIHTTSLFNFMS